VCGIFLYGIITGDLETAIFFGLMSLVVLAVGIGYIFFSREHLELSETSVALPVDQFWLRVPYSDITRVEADGLTGRLTVWFRPPSYASWPMNRKDWWSVLRMRVPGEAVAARMELDERVRQTREVRQW
jgi:hypothetical protein